MRQSIAAYISLTKPRIVSMVVLTTALGYFLGGRGIPSCSLLNITLLGTALSCAGAAVLNNFVERDSDSKMNRTKNRPLPLKLLNPGDALVFGILLVLGGTALLVWKINLLTGFLSLLTAFLYVLVYTPLKKITWLNTFIGAIPGALPPMGGWAAATGSVDLGAWILFFILFIWQHPHFYAIAWMCREDYARGGYKMLPVVEPDGASTFRQVLIYSVILLPVSVIPTFMGLAGDYYLFGVLAFGLGMLFYGVKLAQSKGIDDARMLLRASIIYFPVLLVLIVADSPFYI